MKENNTAEQLAKNTELTDEELDGVAGGMSQGAVRLIGLMNKPLSATDNDHKDW